MGNEQWLLWLILYMLVVLGITRLLHWVLLRTGADDSAVYRVVRILCAVCAVAYPVALAFPLQDVVLSGASLAAVFTSMVCIEYTAWGRRMPWLAGMLLTVLLLCINMVAVFFFVMFSGAWRT
ncbi:MAG TPA: hypothetical protein VK167_05485 [Flavipsychrobacter sp.]|nr:hypothetical protein [Flavipsychrobacter sp.]